MSIITYSLYMLNTTLMSKFQKTLYFEPVHLVIRNEGVRSSYVTYSLKKINSPKYFQLFMFFQLVHWLILC